MSEIKIFKSLDILKFRHLFHHTLTDSGYQRPATNADISENKIFKNFEIPK